MSKMKKYAKKADSSDGFAVVNFMNGISYRVNPLLNLRMIAASSIFGEKAYYRNSGMEDGEKSGSTTDLFESAVDAALDYDFKATISLASILRNDFNMRLNPAVIMIRSAKHPSRVEFNKEHGNYFSEILKSVFVRPDDVSSQFEYYMYAFGVKNGIPTILKKAWNKYLSSLSSYHAAKYKSKASIIDLVRICHANSPVIDELMKTGMIKIPESEKTWENLRSEGKTWEEIVSSIKMPHMALLRNLSNLSNMENGVSKSVMIDLLKRLESGVETGKQFPFRYYSAYNVIMNNESGKYKSEIMDSLERCMDESMKHFPVLKGKTACLSDNSGSARGTFTSEYGRVGISDIGNLSSIVTAVNSEEGHVFAFGDKLIPFTISKRNGVLNQMKDFDEKGEHVGQGTENGIWIFFDKIIKTKEHYDTIFIYSDMQAGHGGLYGLNPAEYSKFKTSGRYIDVLALVKEYRKQVNPKVNVFSVQIAGYNNSLLPETTYRTAILSGWTGKEVLYAKEMIDVWDKIDAENSLK